MTESIIRETTQLRAELQHGSVDTRFDLPAIVKEQARETMKNIKNNTGVPVDYSQVLIMAIRRGLAVFDNQLAAEYNAETMDSYIQQANEAEKNAFDYITNKNNQ